jgi:hypothetical protein
MDVPGCPGDNILAKIKEGLDQSRVMVLFMSANAFGYDWERLEAGARSGSILHHSQRPQELEDGLALTG